MRHRLRLWSDWAARKFGALHTPSAPRVGKIRFGYEKAGLRVWDEPIPWNAEAVLLEAQVLLPEQGAWARNDFHLRLLDHAPLPAAALQPLQPEGFALAFRLPPLRGHTTVEVCWRGQALGKTVLPFLPAEEFLHNLRLQSPTLFVRLGDHEVPCQAVVAEQCHGLRASALLTSPTSLLPLIDVDFLLVFQDQGASSTEEVPLTLTRTQLLAREALVSACPRERPERVGPWSVRWLAGGRVLAGAALRPVSAAAFQRSLYVVDARYGYQEKNGLATFSPFLPERDKISRLGPAFRVASREPGMAGLLPLEVRARLRGALRSSTLLTQEVLVTDAPARLAPPRMTVEDFQQVAAFELLCQGQTLGVLSGCLRPVATFTSEGGFRAPADSDWIPISDEEMEERLRRLMGESEDGVPRDSSTPVSRSLGF